MVSARRLLQTYPYQFQAIEHVALRAPLRRWPSCPHRMRALPTRRGASNKGLKKRALMAHEDAVAAAVASRTGGVSLDHLDLFHNRFLHNLPESLGELNNLQTLDLSGCIRLKGIAKRIGEIREHGTSRPGSKDDDDVEGELEDWSDSMDEEKLEAVSMVAVDNSVTNGAERRRADWKEQYLMPRMGSAAAAAAAALLVK
ncbi:hypothetical protein ZWY2020_038615 [Hordeum vulgare]|nr:hypothetical protein ZWY2020_038615 [Hordeum vulgare]